MSTLTSVSPIERMRKKLAFYLRTVLTDACVGIDRQMNTQTDRQRQTD